LLFSAVLLAVAFFFGMRAGIVGSLLAAVVFASFLFSPVRSIHVANETARSNLGWMLLIGISFSLLFAPPSSGLGRR
jgi:K+-sensing histidine kinase KdpD